MESIEEYLTPLLPYLRLDKEKVYITEKDVKDIHVIFSTAQDALPSYIQFNFERRVYYIDLPLDLYGQLYDLNQGKQHVNQSLRD